MLEDNELVGVGRGVGWEPVQVVESVDSTWSVALVLEPAPTPRFEGPGNHPYSTPPETPPLNY